MRPVAASVAAALLLGSGAAWQRTAKATEPPGATRDVTRTSAIQPNDPRVNGAACGQGTGADGPWPFDQAKAWEAVRDGVSYRRSEGYTLRDVTIRVGDNGISDTHRDVIPLSLRSHKRRNTPGGPVIVHGISSDSFGDVTPPHPDGDWWHGAEVAHLALGGAVFWRADPTALSERIKVTFARLFDAGGVNTVQFQEGVLAMSLQAWEPRPAVVNFSVGSPDPFAGFEGALHGAVTYRQLVVVAAGNEERDLSEHASYPALYARDYPSVLVVGAHDRNGLLLGFSNRGREHVHLLALGCGLAPATSDTQMSQLSGTSFAAPVVSFTAAMLLSFDPPGERQSVEVRERLRITARRLAPENEAAVAYGIVDVPAALRLFDDVVRLSDGTLLHGEWTHEGARDRRTVDTLCRKKEGGRDWSTISLDRLARVRVYREEAGVRLRLLIRERTTSRLPFWEDECEPAAAGFDFAPERGERGVRPWHDVADLMPTRDFTDRRPATPTSSIASAPPPFGIPSITSSILSSITLPGVELRSALRSMGLGVDGGEPPTPMSTPVPPTPAPSAVRDALVRGGLAPENPTPTQQRAAIEAFQTMRREAVTGELTRRQARDLNSLSTRN